MTRHMSWLAPLLAALIAALPSGAGPVRAGTGADCSRAGAHDFDGDGRDDVVMGDPLADAGGARGAGAVHILPLDAAGAAATTDTTGQGLVVTAPGPRPGDAFGWAVRTAHLDGDGCLDVIVGAPYADTGDVPDAGAVHVIYGGRVPSRARVTITPPSPERDAHFGWSLATTSAPGRPRVIAVGAPYEDADRVPDSGAVYLYALTSTGLGIRTTKVTQESEGVIGNGEQGDMFGWSLVFGRLGGRAETADLAIGTPYENDDGYGKQGGEAGQADTGAVEVVFDVAEADPRRGYTSVKWGIPQSVKGLAQRPGDRYGYALAYAEHAGRRYLAVSAPLADAGGVADAGLVEVFGPGRSGRLVPARTIRAGTRGLAGPPQAGAALGTSLAMLRGRDGLRLAIGGSSGARGGTRAGVIRTVALSGDASDRTLQPDRPGDRYDRFGWSIAAFGATEPFGAGTGLLAGSPDRRSAPGGAVAVWREGDDPRWLVPGRAGVPAIPDGSSADFGAAVSG